MPRRDVSDRYSRLAFATTKLIVKALALASGRHGLVMRGQNLSRKTWVLRGVITTVFNGEHSFQDQRLRNVGLNRHPSSKRDLETISRSWQDLETLHVHACGNSSSSHDCMDTYGCWLPTWRVCHQAMLIFDCHATCGETHGSTDPNWNSFKESCSRATGLRSFMKKIHAKQKAHLQASG